MPDISLTDKEIEELLKITRWLVDNPLNGLTRKEAGKERTVRNMMKKIVKKLEEKLADIRLSNATIIEEKYK